MLEIIGIRNRINNIEAELKEMGADTLCNTVLIFQARTAIAKLETVIGLLEKDIQEIRNIKKGE